METQLDVEDEYSKRWWYEKRLSIERTAKKLTALLQICWRARHLSICRVCLSSQHVSFKVTIVGSSKVPKFYVLHFSNNGAIYWRSSLPFQSLTGPSCMLAKESSVQCNPNHTLCTRNHLLMQSRYPLMQARILGLGL